MQQWIITGSATEDGAPLYLQASGRWSRCFSDAHMMCSKQQHESLLEEAKMQQRVVCDPNVIPARLGSDQRPTPTSLRERIRAHGPTVSLVGAVGTGTRAAAASG